MSTPEIPRGKQGGSTTVTYRMPAELHTRFLDIAAASRRSKASLIHESLEDKLPQLEQTYAAQLAQLRQRRAAMAVGSKTSKPKAKIL